VKCKRLRFVGWAMEAMVSAPQGTPQNAQLRLKHKRLRMVMVIKNKQNHANVQVANWHAI